MPHFTTRHQVAHSADDMFALVADVRAYPEFVPLCQALRVRGESPLPDGRSVIVADMTVAYKMFRETFTSRVELDPESRTILVTYLDGPFKKMENRWRFEELSEKACVVEFFIDYEFRSRTLASLMGAMFDKAFRKFSTAFEARADALYGTPNAA
ncbi:MAG: type II toxin-antitoxin system RatA family toxin [Devosiaceae bacterium]|nr:type II toxin-antitoxin system RatA family toxin [Devosiaceae bacterium MH13]